MRNRHGWLAALCLALGFAALSAAGDAPHARSPFSQAMHASMAKMMRAMEQAEMTGDPDHDFLAMMIPHHAGAVDMARLELVHGRDPLVRRLAEEIIASQQSEIAAMQARLEILKKRRPGDAHEYPSLHGTRGGEDAR